MFKKTLKYSIISLVVIALVACGQKTTNLSEKEFVNTISNTDTEGGLQEIDVDLIVQMIESNPQTMVFSFDKPDDVERDFYLPEYFSLATSDDENIRIYNIETNGGRVSTNDYNLRHFVQFKRNEKVFLKELPDYANSNFFVDTIYSIKTENQTYYLFRFTMAIMAMGSHYAQIIKAYRIDNESNLNSKKLFKTKKENLDKIEISWDYSTYDDDETGIITRTEGENDEIIYDNDKLLVPLIVSYGNNGLMTEGNLVYQWKSDHFEYTGIDPIKIFETNKFRVQIDIMSNGKYRYTSWSKNKKMSDKPDLIIDNGTYTEDNESRFYGGNMASYSYTFKTKEYIYLCHFEQIGNNSENYLIVEKNGKAILKEKFK
jgi:hypothetical protein